MGNKSTLEKYRSKEEKKFGEWLGREEGRTVFNIRAGSLGLRNRTGRTVQDKTCQKCTEGEIENEQHVVLKCPAYRIERNRMLGKVRRIWGEERYGVWGGKDEGEQLKEIVGLVGEPSEVRGGSRNLSWGGARLGPVYHEISPTWKMSPPPSPGGKNS